MGFEGEIRVLVVPGTTEIGLEVFRSLRDIRGVAIYGAGVDVRYGRDFGFEGYEFLPESSDIDYIDELGALCETWAVDFIYPAHDQVIFDLREYPSFMHTKVVTHPQEAVFVCRSKHRTYEQLRDLAITPRVFGSLDEIDQFPVFVKPSEGQGSVGAYLAASRDDLIYRIEDSHVGILDFFDAFVVSEYLHGEEVTVDCFSTPSAGLQYCAARTRASVRGGIAVHTESIESDELSIIAEQVGQRVKMSGAWFFQAMRNVAGDFKVTEVATRLAGSSGLRRAQGVNLAHLSLLNAMNETVSVLEQVGASRSRRVLTDLFLDPPHFERIYVDFDDTLIRNGQVNAELLGFLVAARTKGIGVHLLTRHNGDLASQLLMYRLDGLFESIAHLVDGTPKSHHVDDSAGALFIDDSFNERREVVETRGCLAIDASAVSGLWGFLNGK